MRPQAKIPTSHKIGETLRLRSGQAAGTLEFVFLMIMILVTGIAACAEEKPVPVSYDLKVTIEPGQGTVAVHGNLAVPVEADTKTLQFGLHETFAIKKLLINGHAAKFSFQPGDPSPIYPATRKVLVTLPPSVPAGKVPLEIEYGGRLKEIPEFGTFPDQKQALDDQINPRLVELANYSSWYPQFFVFGRPIEAKLEVLLPKGWIAICSGKKADEREQDGRTVTRWASAQDTDILITAAPSYKGKVIPLGEGRSTSTTRNYRRSSSIVKAARSRR